MTIEELIKKCFSDYKKNLPYYQKMQRYYRNESDVVITKSEIDTSSTGKLKSNYLKKFIKSETDYILGNPVTFKKLSDDEDQENDTKFNLSHWRKDHDKVLFRKALLYGRSYEIYFTDSDGLFSGHIVTPLNGYAYFEYDKMILFLYVFKKQFDNDTYTDVYLEDRILHYKSSGASIGTLIGEDEHPFNGVPVGACIVDDDEYDTLFEDIKTLQDAYELNISDLSHEISQYRQAYLKLINCQIEESSLPLMRKMGILNLEGNDSVDAEWLIKNINSDFVMGTLKEIKQNIYELSCHINNNEQVPSNNSSLAMRTRQLDLENKTKSNMDAMFNLIKVRLKFLYQYIAILRNKKYDYRLLDPMFTPSLPQDDLLMSQVLSQLPDGYVSKETGRSKLSFIDNVSLEEKRVKKEQSEDITAIGQQLLDKAGDIVNE